MSERPGPASVDYYECAAYILKRGVYDGEEVHGFDRTIREVVTQMSSEDARSETYARHKPTRAEIRAMAHDVIDEVFDEEYGVDELTLAKEQNKGLDTFENTEQ